VTDPLVWLPFDPELLDAPPSGLRYEVVVPSDVDEVPESIGEVEVYVPPYRFSELDSALIPRMSSLKLVQTMTAGVEHVRPHVPQGVLLCNGRGIHDASTAELAMTLMLSSLRGVSGFVRAQDAGVWAHGTRPALADSTVLVVGYGAIGEAVERRLAGFEVEVVRVARSSRDGVHAYGELPDLLPGADVVVLVVPLTDLTRRMVDAAFLARMKDGALLVNVARGAVVDTDALVAALRSGRISAALDVTDPEPLPHGHPLWGCPNLLVTPHVGGASTAMEPRAYRLVRDQLARFAAGEPLANVMTGDY
jgi:phosphoglycerate dehydrogenase-like enzyme